LDSDFWIRDVLPAPTQGELNTLELVASQDILLAIVIDDKGDNAEWWPSSDA
jgi:hypothetical protein